MYKSATQQKVNSSTSAGNTNKIINYKKTVDKSNESLNLSFSAFGGGQGV